MTTHLANWGKMSFHKKANAAGKLTAEESSSSSSGKRSPVPGRAAAAGRASTVSLSPVRLIMGRSKHNAAAASKGSPAASGSVGQAGGGATGAKGERDLEGGLPSAHRDLLSFSFCSLLFSLSRGMSPPEDEARARAGG